VSLPASQPRENQPGPVSSSPLPLPSNDATRLALACLLGGLGGGILIESALNGVLEILPKLAEGISTSAWPALFALALVVALVAYILHLFKSCK
jgi:hypothetical protein